MSAPPDIQAGLTEGGNHGCHAASDFWSGQVNASLTVRPARAECQGTGDLLIMDDKGPLCLACADLDHLIVLPAGDAALTRRAKKASGLSAVVVRWSRTRK